MGRLAFLEITDGSSSQTLQVSHHLNSLSLIADQRVLWFC